MLILGRCVLGEEVSLPWLAEGEARGQITAFNLGQGWATAVHDQCEAAAKRSAISRGEHSQVRGEQVILNFFHYVGNTTKSV